MSDEPKKCKNCGRPVREDFQPPFMEEEFPSFAVYHNDGGDPMFCYGIDDPRDDEAAL